MGLKEFFHSIKDFRRAQGQRYKLEPVLWMIFLGISSGYTGYRELSVYMKSHKAYFTEVFSLKYGVPSHVTIRTILIGLDKPEFLTAFNTWAERQKLSPGDWLSGDGKSLNSTVINAHESEQSFCSIVSLFCQRTGLVYQIADFRSKKKSEGEILRQLLPSLQDKGINLTLDALHCQKKQLMR
jgi:DDE_Tnp_1-associated